MHHEQIIAAHRLLEKNGSTRDAQLHEIKSYRALFLSDIHLGSRGCKAKELVGLLNHVKPDVIHLNGDIIDGWQLGIFGPHHIGKLFQNQSQKVHSRMPQAHADVLQKLLRLGRSGTYIFYIPGNHDEFIRPYLPLIDEIPEAKIERNLEMLAASLETTRPSQPALEIASFFDDMRQIGRIFLVHNVVHRTANDKRLYVTHGDEFDALLKGSRILGLLGTRSREALFGTSEWLSRNDKYWLIRTASRRLLGLSEQFSLADYAYHYKNNSDLVLPKVAAAYLYTQNEITEKKRDTQLEWYDEPRLSGIVCGHNHIPAIIELSESETQRKGFASKPPSADKTYYMNCGDWMANCTALVEEHDGRIHLIRWDNKEGIVDVDPSLAQRPDTPDYISGRYVKNAYL